MKRTELINRIINKYSFKKYLEIGIFDGGNFNAINVDEKYSVDPTFPARFKMTSDQFFENMSQHPMDSGWDVVFVDGMHTAGQAHRDIVNSLQHLNDGGFIVVHDCNPENEWATRPPDEYKRGEVWNGDVYKAFIKFKQEHPELTCITVDTDYGCGVITNRFKNLTEYATLGPIDYVTWDHFDKNRAELLGLTSVDDFKELI